MTSGEFLGFIFASCISDLEAEETSNQEMPMLQTKKTLTKAQQDGTYLDNNCSTPAKHHHRKTCDLIWTYTSTDRVESLDFHPHKAIPKGPNTAARVVSEKDSRELGISSPRPSQRLPTLAAQCQWRSCKKFGLHPHPQLLHTQTAASKENQFWQHGNIFFLTFFTC